MMTTNIPLHERLNALAAYANQPIFGQLMYYAKYSNFRIEEFEASSEYIRDTGLSTVYAPIVDVKTKERGIAPCLFLEVSFPSLRDEFYRCITRPKSFIMQLIEDGLPERVIPSFPESPVDENLRHIPKRFLRYWKEEELTTETLNLNNAVSKDLACCFFLSNLRKWEARGKGSPIKTMEDANFHLSLAVEMGHTFTHVSNQRCSAIVETVSDLPTKTLHWVNSHLPLESDHTAKETRFGNNIICSLYNGVLLNDQLQTLNLGIDFFPYKALWSDTVKYATGLRYD